MRVDLHSAALTVAGLRFSDADPVLDDEEATIAADLPAGGARGRLRGWALAAVIGLALHTPLLLIVGVRLLAL
ncbi:hypothetical protein [Roseicella aquatilis]|uniref:Uncharacterized protein n=1 Tax=Roseicella aquatilis TaxID=2527868 RepID=A0A4V2WK13_9PROT|nr:hypothetical protein [Roseicella aquatilis]TCZ56644.1 hypothetical protein EXY23_19845 [Roseicella aquatilis]